jgi:hypothetical protein
MQVFMLLDGQTLKKLIVVTNFWEKTSVFELKIPRKL